MMHKVRHFFYDALQIQENIIWCFRREASEQVKLEIFWCFTVVKSVYAASELQSFFMMLRSFKVFLWSPPNTCPCAAVHQLPAASCSMLLRWGAGTCTEPGVVGGVVRGAGKGASWDGLEPRPVGLETHWRLALACADRSGQLRWPDHRYARFE